MDWNTILDGLINTLQPEHVPSEFLIQATYTDRHGTEHTITGIELMLFMANPSRFHTHEAHVVFDVRKIRRVMHDQVMEFLLYLNARQMHKK